MLTLCSGRPEDCSGRLDKEIKCYDFLDALGVEYQRIDHEPAMTMEVCAEIDKSLHAVICKNLFLTNRQETAFYLLLIPGDKPFKTKFLSAQLGVSRLSFGRILAAMSSFASVVVSGHELDELAQWATKFYVLRDGKLVGAKTAAGVRSVLGLAAPAGEGAS